MMMKPRSLGAVVALLVAGCTAQTETARQVEPEALVRAAYGADAVITSLWTKGDVSCGYAEAQSQMGVAPFMIEHGTLIQFDADREAFRRCPPDFVPPNRVIPVS